MEVWKVISHNVNKFFAKNLRAFPNPSSGRRPSKRFFEAMRRWRWGDGETGRWGDGETGRGDGATGRWGEGVMVRWGEGETGDD